MRYDPFRRVRTQIAYIIVIWTIITCMFIMAGCAQNINIKPVAEMTPKEKSLAAMKIYNAQVDAYKAKLALPDLSAAEKKVLRVELATFEKTWPVIKAYDDYVQGLTTSVEEAIIIQINRLILDYRY